MVHQLRELSLSTILMITFGLLGVTLFLVSSVGYLGLTKTQNQVEHLYEEKIKAMKLLNEIKGDSLLIRSNVLLINAAHGPKDAEVLRKQNEEYQKRLEQARQELAPLLHGDDEVHMNEFAQLWNEFMIAARRIAPANESGHGLEAGESQLNSDIAKSTKAIALLDKLVEQNTKEAHEAFLEAEQVVSFSTGTMALLSITGIVGALIIGLATIRFINGAFAKLTGIAERISHGDLTVEIENLNGNNEIAVLTRAFVDMKTQLREIIGLVSQHASKVGEASEELTASAEQTALATEQIAQTMQAVATESEKQVESVSVIASTIHQMNEQQKSISQLAGEMNDAARNTSTHAQDGNVSVSQAVTQMNQIHRTVMESANLTQVLGNRSQEIGQIVTLISEISSQTNLLALNAAIEAARAGEHGRGFAVVAEEVRKLAEQSSSAAEEISGLVNEIQKETSNVVKSMDAGIGAVTQGIQMSNEAGDSFKLILSAVEGLMRQAEEVTQAIGAVASGAESINSSIQEIEQGARASANGTQNVAAAAEEQTATMQEISASASTLSGMASELNKLTGRFRL